MNPQRAVILGLIVLSGFVTAAEKVPKLVREIDELRDGGNVREAIAAYRKVVVEHRRDLRFSVPALVGLVASYQKLKDDEAARAEYTELMSSWLSQAPPLDGAAELTIAQAEDDLLWKPWEPKLTEPVFTFAFKNAYRSIVVSPNSRSESVQFVFHGLSEDHFRLIPDEIGTNANQAKPPIWKAQAEDGTPYDLQIGSSIAGADGAVIVINLCSNSLPSTVKKLSSVNGTLFLRQRLYEQQIRTPLAVGAYFKAGFNQTGQIRKCSSDSDLVRVQIAISNGIDEEVALCAAEAEENEEVPSTIDAAIAATGLSYWMVDGSGKQCLLSGGRTVNDGKDTIVDCTFRGGAVAPKFVIWRMNETYSRREVKVVMENLEVP